MSSMKTFELSSIGSNRAVPLIGHETLPFLLLANGPWARPYEQGASHGLAGLVGSSFYERPDLLFGFFALLRPVLSWGHDVEPAERDLAAQECGSRLNRSNPTLVLRIVPRTVGQNE